MNYLSVCSGIEAASVAWHPLGWKPVAFSEVDKFPSAVLKHHFPDTPNWGDMTKFGDWPNVPVDVLVGGTPCQSFSLAGQRTGMDDPRGQLSICYSGILAKYRPRWFVWENVPGVLSSNRGRDFGAFIQSLVELGYGVCWRVLDAQHVRTQRHPRAVPQRRRRVFAVGHLGGWQRAAATLFVRESGMRDPSAREWSCVEERETVGTVTTRTGVACDNYSAEVGHCIIDDRGPRWLTPRECERLQGFPDDWTKIPYRGKNPEDCPDGPRYKAIGNSMAVPCMSWIGKRIAAVDAITKEFNHGS